MRQALRHRAGWFPVTLADLIARFRREDRGVIALEFGLSLPLYLAALFGLLEVGRILFTLGFLHYAAQEGTRYAIVRDGLVNEAQIEEFTSKRLIGVVDGETAVVTTTAPVDPDTGTRLVTVRIILDYQPWVPVFPAFSLGADSSGFLAFPN